MPSFPEKIGKYIVVQEIARGGMGAIYKARHPTLNRLVVIKKLMIAGQSQARERFRREAQIMMDLRNEYIVDVFDHFKEGNAYYIVQEFVDGMSLEGLLKRDTQIPERIALLIFRDACRALVYAHEHGIIHRDIKPANILLSKRGQVKLVDFGIAHVEDEESSMTREGTTLGTPSYMPPEQFDNTAAVDKRADIYALGIMLYEMLAGKRPYPGSYRAETIRLIQQGRYTPLRKHCPKSSLFVRKLTRKAMKTKPRRRFQSLRPVLRLLEHRLGPSAPEKTREELQRFIAGNWKPPLRSGKPLRTFLLSAFFALFAITGVASFCLYTGWHYEYLLASRYGALSITVDMANEGIPARQVYLEAKLFKDDGAAIPELEDIHVRFTLDKNLSSERRLVFRSSTIWLPPGAYRVKQQSGTDVFWNSFILESRTTQKQTAAHADGQTITIRKEAPRAVPLTIDTRITSAASSLPLGNIATVEVFNSDSWQDIKGPDAPLLQSGMVHRFKISAPDYYPSYWDLLVKERQEVLRIDCALVPHPAGIRIKTENQGITLKINDLHHYKNWGAQPSEAPIPRLGSDYTSFLVAPGKYELVFNYGQNELHHVLTLASNELETLDISYDSSIEKIRISARKGGSVKP